MGLFSVAAEPRAQRRDRAGRRGFQGPLRSCDQEGEAALRFATATAASLIFPFAPHLASEAYDALTGNRVWEEPWPQADPELLTRDTFTLVVQVNGKRRDQIEAAVNAGEQELLELARASENVRRHLDGKEVVKEVVVPGKLVNLVVR